MITYKIHCKTCRFFHDGPRAGGSSPKCTLYPEHISVRENHFCGQHEPNAEIKAEVAKRHWEAVNEALMQNVKFANSVKLTVEGDY